MAKTRGFQSDLSTLLLGVGASVTYASRPSATDKDVPTTTVPYAQFLSSGPKFDGVLTSITLPLHTAAAGVSPVFMSYKTSIRPENSHALLNAAFSVQLTGVSDQKGTAATISSAVLAYGGVAYGTPGDVAQRATNTEAAITGKPLNEDTLQLAVKALAQEFKIQGERADYRQRMVTSFFVRLPTGSCAMPLPPAAPSAHCFRSVIVWLCSTSSL